MNVIAPAIPSDDPEGYPVLVFIHGGGFWYGDVVMLGYDKVTKTLAKRGVITVTMPYRVGLYGKRFLQTEIYKEILFRLHVSWNERRPR